MAIEIESDGAPGCSTCTGAIVIPNAANGNYTGGWDYDADFSVLGQFSKFVRSGAYRIDSNNSSDGVIQDVAILNPDGSHVLVVYNSSRSQQTSAVQTNVGSFNFAIPALSRDKESCHANAFT